MHAAAVAVARRALAVAAAAVFVAGCTVDEPQIPLDKPLFPTGLALVPGAGGADDPASHLIVVSSDFNSAFTDSTSSGLEERLGGLLSADLDDVRASGKETVTGAYTSGVVISGFGDRPVLSPDNDRVFVPLRGDNVVASIDVGADGKLTCQSKEKPERCGISPGALQLPQADPFTVLPLSQDGDRVTAMVTLLSSSTVTFFTDDKAREGAARMRITSTLDLGPTIGGVRSAVLRPALYGTDTVVIAPAELSNAENLVGAQILIFNPTSDSDIVGFDITAASGSLSIRDVLLVPGDDGEDDAVIVTLRGPDAVARLEIDDAGALPTLRLSKLAPTCRLPTDLALWHDGNRHPDRVLLTCQTGDVVEALDPLTLEPTDALRFEGRNPFTVVVDQAADEAFVSFFKDDSIGVFSLGDGGAPKLSFEKRIGTPTPAPEDGRQ